METQTQDFRYHVIKNRFVVMTEADEMDWLYRLISKELTALLGNNSIHRREFYDLAFDDGKVRFKKLDLMTIVNLAQSLGVDCEKVENQDCFFHLNDKNDNAHGFDINDFNANNQQLLNSFGDIILKYFECQSQPIIPIKLPSFPDLLIGDAIILIPNQKGKKLNVEVMLYTHPEYKTVTQKMSLG